MPKLRRIARDSGLKGSRSDTVNNVLKYSFDREEAPVNGALNDDIAPSIECASERSRCESLGDQASCTWFIKQAGKPAIYSIHVTEQTSLDTVPYHLSGHSG